MLGNGFFFFFEKSVKGFLALDYVYHFSYVSKFCFSFQLVFVSVGIVILI